MTGPVLFTERLILRRPEEDDFPAMAAMMADDETTRFIGGVQSEPIAWRAFASVLGHWQLRGYGFFSVLEKETGQWLGRVGPWYPHGWIQPEIGWTLTRDSWGRGYAVEAARAAMDFVFDRLAWDSVIHLIDADNTPSQAVASRIGSRNLEYQAEVAGFDMKVDVWGQNAGDWAEFRKTLA
ncbi:GNAT family N-acetyltransferase [Maricaulis sp. D1M11]|uniref:GNAT family N-acetyltransferase n=1 Tax=Maricaulis sp. D1M11 TaxID=3076117 RepID=UPI0039B4CD12